MSMLDPTMHKSTLIQILKDIYSNTKIAPFLGFKGGTALYVFYKLDRFSVDLDFDLLDSEQKDIVYDEIKKILVRYGSVKDAYVKRYSIFFLLSYHEVSYNIKVEINMRKFGSQYELKNYLGISMLVMSREDMFAHKLVAMYERLGKANRDVYDVHFLLKRQWPINKEIVEGRTGLSFDDFIKECIARLPKLNKRSILSGIGDLITAQQKSWVKSHLVEDTILLMQLNFNMVD